MLQSQVRLPVFECSFSFNGISDHRVLHSFPTRRSSDLGCIPAGWGHPASRGRGFEEGGIRGGGEDVRFDDADRKEHTSELQSRQYLVCRLLLEKKKKLAHPTTVQP